MRNLHRRDLAIKQIAPAAAVSRRTLYYVFQKEMGDSVGAVIRRLRVIRAQRLLTETDLSIKSVALQCGFTSALQLRRALQRQSGISPMEFRKTAQNRG